MLLRKMANETGSNEEMHENIRNEQTTPKAKNCIDDTWLGHFIPYVTSN